MDTLYSAVENGDVKLVRELLRDTQMDPGANDDILELILLKACDARQAEVVKILLLDPRVDPSANDTECLVHACKYNCAEVVKVLLKDPRVDPRVRNYSCITLASDWHYLETLKLLMTDKRTWFDVNSISDRVKTSVYNCVIQLEESNDVLFIELLLMFAGEDVDILQPSYKNMVLAHRERFVDARMNAISIFSNFIKKGMPKDIIDSQFKILGGDLIYFPVDVSGQGRSRDQRIARVKTQIMQTVSEHLVEVDTRERQSTRRRHS